MSENIYKFFPKKENDMPYRTQEEYFIDLAKSIEMIFAYYVEVAENASKYVKRKMISNISKEGIGQSIEYNKNKQMCVSDYTDAKNIINRKKYLKSLKSETNIFLAFDYVCDYFNFSELEEFCFTVAFILNNYKKLTLFLPYVSTFSESNINYNTIIDLYEFISDEEDNITIEQVKQLKKKMKLFIFDEDSSNTELILMNEMVNNFIVSDGTSCGEYKYMDIYFPKKRSLPLLVMNDIANSIYEFSKHTGNDKAWFYYINGKPKSGRTTQVKRYGDLSGQVIIFIDLNQLLLVDLEKIIISASRIAMLNDASICIKNLQLIQRDPASEDTVTYYKELDEKFVLLLKVIDKLAMYLDTVFLLSEYEKYNAVIKDNRQWIDIKMRMPTFEESTKLWKQGLFSLSLDCRIRAEELASKFDYTPGQIIDAASDAARMSLWKGGRPLTKREFYSCIYNQVSHNLEKKADLVYTKHTWENLILPEKEKKMLRNACNQLKFKNKVYEQWGMNERITYGRGISMLFAGPPGTGKTMGAHVVANELGIEMYKVNLSQIVSKYIGETEKNLNEIFQEAKKTNVILFFDETDAILGKRTEVKDSKDKNANMETSYLLQKMEEYDGITVMTTNYIENIDNAFFRRISYVIHFPFPEPAYRKKIWENMFPKKMPIEDIDFDYLGNQFEIAGGNIKNTVVAAAFMAASENEAVSMGHIVKALKYEMSKQGKNMLKDDFGEYGFLLED
ncbi:MAG: ATP-binding protein [Clostridia bacterium]|nr:ATP-binding protein [Clostridia bacterium]